VSNDNPWLLSPEESMRRKTTVKTSGKIKLGVQCPACEDIIFSFYQHDFRRCMCGKVFVDGGDDYMRTGAEAPVELENVITVYRPLKEAERLMSKAVREKLPMSPPPKSYFIGKRKLQFVWSWKRWLMPRVLGAYPRTGKFAGSIYKWVAVAGPLEIRRWAD